MKKTFSFRRLGATTLMAAAIAPVLAEAGVFSVTPVRIYMTPKDRAVAVTITNDGDTPVVLQADINLWTQKADGTDELTLSEDLILSPPIIKLGPKAKQVVRLASLKPADAAKQLTYRLVLREIPEAVAPKDPGIQLPIALALSMPVFITPPPAQRVVQCTAARAGASLEITASCGNVGTAYAQVRDATLKRGDAQLARFEGGQYILPGARKAIPLKADKPVAAGAAELVVSFDDGRTQAYGVTLP